MTYNRHAAKLCLTVVHSAAFDALPRATVAEIRNCSPNLIAVEFPDRGQIPFLDEPKALEAIGLWLDRVRGATRKRLDR